MVITKKFVQKALDTYLSHISQLPAELQIHLAIRLFRLTHEHRYIQILTTQVKNTFPENFAFVQSAVNGIPKENSEFHIRGSILRNPLEYKRIERRTAFYHSHPSLQPLVKSLSILRNWYDTKLHEGTYATEIRSLLSSLRQKPWADNFVLKEHFIANPVHFVNSVYALNFLEIEDLRDTLLDWTQELYPPLVPLHEEKLYDQVYVYTHIIINESKFYQRFLSTKQVEKYSWILTFFDQHFLTIYPKINLDLVLEMIVCFQLCNQPLPKWVSTAHAWIMKHYNANTAIIQADSGSTIADMEHLYSLIFLHTFMPEKLAVIKTPLF